MKRVDLKEWGIIRNTKNERSSLDTVFECESGDYAFYFYGIEEYGILKFYASLRIYRNKIAPEIIFDNNAFCFVYNSFNEIMYIEDWSSDGYVCLVELLTDNNTPNYPYAYFIIDLKRLKYASINGNYVEIIKDEGDSVSCIRTRKIEREKDVFYFDKMNWRSLRLNLKQLKLK
jgi:hypothetical protein